MEIVIANILVIGTAIILAIIAIRQIKKPKKNDKCLNCGKAVPVDDLCS